MSKDFYSTASSGGLFALKLTKEKQSVQNEQTAFNFTEEQACGKSDSFFSENLTACLQETEEQACEKNHGLFSENLTSCPEETGELTYKHNNKSELYNPDHSINSCIPEKSKTENGKEGTGQDLTEREKYLRIIKENIEYDFLGQEDKRQADNIIDIMLDVLCSEREKIRVNGEDLPAKAVKERFLQIDITHIEYLLTALKKNTSDVRNIRAYLITAIYNAPATIDSYYAARVNHDLALNS